MSWLSTLVVFLAGCEKVEVVVESNTSWEGDICPNDNCASANSGHKFRGSGNKSFDDSDYESGVLGGICYWFGNTTDSGYVRVYIREKDILGSSEHTKHQNSAPHGAVSDCWTPSS
jgi:hypothetical protein